jgi:hypothetical protein
MLHLAGVFVMIRSILLCCVFLCLLACICLNVVIHLLVGLGSVQYYVEVVRALVLFVL